MNRLHHWLCRSDAWRETIQQRVPWVLSGADLGPNVLELGPGHDLATDLLRPTVQRLTAIEVDPKLAESLSSRLRGSNVRVVTGDATAMPFPDAHFSGGVSYFHALTELILSLHSKPIDMTDRQPLCPEYFASKSF